MRAHLALTPPALLLTEPIHVLVDLQRSLLGIDEPEPGHPHAGVPGGFCATIKGLGPRRENLANPVWSNRGVGSPGSSGEALPPPARQVGHHGVPCDPHLRLDEQDPSPRSSTASLKGAIEGRQDAALCSAVLQSGARQRIELAADQVSDVGGWDAVEVCQGGRSSGSWTKGGYWGLGHRKSLRRAVLSLHPLNPRRVSPSPGWASRWVAPGSQNFGGGGGSLRPRVTHLPRPVDLQAPAAVRARTSG